MNSKMSLAVSLLLLVSASVAPAAPQSINLNGNNHTGYLSIANLKNYGVQPNTVAPLPPDDPNYFMYANNICLYPFYQDGTLWRSIMAEPLSAASVYAEEGSFSVVNKTITDADFSITDIGDITYDDSLLTGVGVETIGPANFTLALSAADFTPEPGRNTGTGAGNFGWPLSISNSNKAGTGLTFNNGVLTGINFTADVAVAVSIGGGALPITPAFNGSIAFTGNSFAYNVNVTQNATYQFGTLSNLHMVVNRAGSLVAVVPEPTAAGTIGFACLGALGWIRRRK